jgi:hypothetical protein
MNRLFVAWQDPDSREWRPVAQLEKKNGLYEFKYSIGARHERFIPLDGMSDLDIVYNSERLFPFFSNRLLSEKRSEFKDFIDWLDLSGSTNLEPIEILARSGGQRETDVFQLFSAPNLGPNDSFKMKFFCNGIRHLDESAQSRIHQLQKRNKLFLMMDVQNDCDPQALAVRSDDPVQILGYLPRYLASEFQPILKDSNTLNKLEITVDKVNALAPIQYRLLCNLEGNSQYVRNLFSSGLYLPIVS